VACGKPAGARYCASCGAVQADATCSHCDEAITAGSRYCESCGSPARNALADALASVPKTRMASSGEAAGAQPRFSPMWYAGAALLLLITFLAGQQIGSNASDAASPEAGGPIAGAPFAGGATRAPDISNLTPEEATARLFDRVMRYSEEGKRDSVQMFAPMALLAYERIGSPDAHTRFDMGTIAVAMEDAPTAKAFADSILKAQPTHLLGLVLALRAAELRRDGGAVSRIRAQLSSAERTELAKGLKEYTDHQREIDRALGRAPAVAPPR